MADLHQMNRTWLCSVVFLDIVDYSSHSVEQQIKWKQRFSGYLAEAIQSVPENERVIIDTGDGAAICFLGAPEAAMFAALEVWHFLLLDERDQEPQMKVRIGINLGPVKLVRDINGAPNALGDGINAGQRIMSFAVENQILVSQSYFEVVSCLSDDYKTLFALKGVQRDKHVREHTVYTLSPPGLEAHTLGITQEITPLPPVAARPAAPPPQVQMPRPVAPAPQVQMPPRPVVASPQPQAPSQQVLADQLQQETRPEKQAGAGRRSILLVAGIALAVVAGAGVWSFLGSAARSNPIAQTASGGQSHNSSASQSATAGAVKPPAAGPVSGATPAAAVPPNIATPEVQSAPRPQIAPQSAPPDPSVPRARTAKSPRASAVRKQVQPAASGVPIPEAPLPPQAPAPVPAGPIAVDGNVQMTRLVRKVIPTYPPVAKTARMAGVVRLMAIIGKDGTVQNVQIVSGNPILARAAVDAVRQWVYRPTVIEGNPVEVSAPIELNFTLEH
jgi:TonB family protein